MQTKSRLGTFYQGGFLIVFSIPLPFRFTTVSTVETAIGQVVLL
ncbi:hypothetical protein [Prevotella intermedia]